MKSVLNILKQKKGVTLIELLVVVVILGIIAAVAIPAVMGNQTAAYVNTNEQNLKLLQDAVQRYSAVNSAYPASLTILTTAVNGGPYMSNIPQAHLNPTGTGGFLYDDGTGVVTKPVGAY